MSWDGEWQVHPAFARVTDKVTGSHVAPSIWLDIHHWEGGKVKVDMAAYAPGAGPFKIAVSVECCVQKPYWK